MSQYVRARDGSVYFFTVVTYGRRPILCREDSRAALKEYVKEAGNYPFDVIMITDQQDKDEIELLKSLIEINPMAYVVMLTGDVTTDKVMGSIRNGASGVLNSPYTADKVRLELEKFSFLREDKIA